MKNKALCAIAGAALCAASCSGPSGWSLKGEIEGSHPEKVALEGYICSACSTLRRKT